MSASLARAAAPSSILLSQNGLAGTSEQNCQPQAKRFATASGNTLPRSVSSSSEMGTMAQITKLSVEKALEKLRGSDARQSKDTWLKEKMDALDEETKRMRAQRMRLERHQRKRDQGDH
jgi:hypothetical protein